MIGAGVHWLWLVGALLWPLSAVAMIDSHEFDDPVLADRYAQLAAELRCPKCQNTNLSGSDAPIAQDLRAQVHDMLLAGKSDSEIKTYLVSRYGEFVLYRPRFAGTHLLLWLAPAVLLLLGAVLLLPQT